MKFSDLETSTQIILKLILAGLILVFAWLVREVIIILLLAGAILLTKIYFKESFLKNNLRAKYAAQHQEVGQLEEKLRKIKAVRELMESRLQGLEVLRGLYAIIPNDIYLNTLNVGEDGVIGMTGIAETTSRVYAFVSALNESKYFDGVKTKSTAGKKDRGKDAVAFEIEFVLKNDAVKDDGMLKKVPVETKISSAKGKQGS